MISLSKRLKLWNEYHNPLYYWWKARKYFKFPNVSIYKGKYRWTFGLPIRMEYYNKFLDIGFHSLGWKTKYESPRHEWSPMIHILFLKKWMILIGFYYDARTVNDAGDFAVWEAILDYVCYDMPIKDCVDNNTWSCHTSGQNMTIEYALTKKGLKEVNGK